MRYLYAALSLATSASAFGFATSDLDAKQTRCFGPATSKNRIIYLHSLDSPGTLGRHFITNRGLMEELATEKKARIWVPRSQATCRKRVCWPQSPSDRLKSVWATLQKSATSSCWPGQQTSGVIGFSNGGFFATKIATRCLSPKLEWIIAIGSHGLNENIAKACIPIHQLIGRKDLAFGKAQQFATRLKMAKIRHSTTVFEGAHIVDKNSLAKLLDTVLHR